MIDSPYFRFIYALRAPETRRQYPKRLEVFLDYLKLLGSSIEEKANQFYEFKDELNYIIDQSRKELLIFSSLSSLNQLFINRHNIAKIKSAQKRGVSIKILTDETDEIFSKQISELNQTNEDNPIRYGHGKSLCCFNEMVVLADGKQVLQTKNQQDGKIFTLSSNEEHMVLVQDVLFEKYWNEIQSLKISDN